MFRNCPEQWVYANYPMGGPAGSDGASNCSVYLAIPEIQFVECRPSSSSSFKLPSNKQSFLIIAKEGPSLGSHGVWDCGPCVSMRRALGWVSFFFFLSQPVFLHLLCMILLHHRPQCLRGSKATFWALHFKGRTMSIFVSSLPLTPSLMWCHKYG